MGHLSPSGMPPRRHIRASSLDLSAPERQRVDRHGGRGRGTSHQAEQLKPTKIHQEPVGTSAGEVARGTVTEFEDDGHLVERPMPEEQAGKMPWLPIWVRCQQVPDVFQGEEGGWSDILSLPATSGCPRATNASCQSLLILHLFVSGAAAPADPTWGNF